MKKITHLKGFTLVELMVVIAIIALLSGIIIANLTQPKAKSRDGKQVSDIAQIQLALEQYFDRCGQYPATPLVTTANAGCPTTPTPITLGSFIAQIPVPPTQINKPAYDYVVTGTPPADYLLHTTFEGSNSALTDSLKTAPSWVTGITCYNGSNLEYCASPK